MTQVLMQLGDEEIELGFKETAEANPAIGLCRKAFVLGAEWATDRLKHAEIRQMLEEEFKLKELYLKEDSMDSRIQAHEGMLRLFASTWVDWFLANGDENFVVVELQYKDFGRFEIIMRRKPSSSAEQLAGEYRRQLDETKQELKIAEDTISDMARQLKKAGL